MLNQKQIDFIKKGLTERAEMFRQENGRYFEGIIEGLEIALRLIETEEKENGL